MSNPWFRLYAEILHDPKVQVLTEALQRRYVMVLCMQCSGYYEKRHDDEIALSLRVTMEEWISTKKEFIKRGLLLENGDINGWSKRQYISDIKDPGAAERQKRYRDNKRNYRNATVTSRLPEADTDTDTDTLKPLSGKPDESAQKTSKPKTNGAETFEVISYLNEKTGTNFKLVEANTKLVAARLKEGATVEDMKRVIDFKVSEWKADSKMREYLRPATLFNAEKFAQYTGQAAKEPVVMGVAEFMKAHS